MFRLEFGDWRVASKSGKATHLSQPFPSSSSFFSFFSSPLLLPQPQGVKNCRDRQLFTRCGWYNGYDHTMTTQKRKFSRPPSSSPSTWSIPCPPSPSTTRIAGKTSNAARSNRDRSGTTRPTELDAVQIRPPFSHASDPSSALWCRAF